MRCVVVEDNPFSRLTLKVAIEKTGNSVVGEADSVKSAKEVLEKTEADLLLLDIILPDGNGLEVLKSLKKDIKVIAITAVDQELVDDELKKNGVKLILKKPFSYDELEEMLKKI